MTCQLRRGPHLWNHVPRALEEVEGLGVGIPGFLAVTLQAPCQLSKVTWVESQYLSPLEESMATPCSIHTLSPFQRLPIAPSRPTSFLPFSLLTLCVYEAGQMHHLCDPVLASGLWPPCLSPCFTCSGQLFMTGLQFPSSLALNLRSSIENEN